VQAFSPHNEILGEFRYPPILNFATFKLMQVGLLLRYILAPTGLLALNMNFQVDISQYFGPLDLLLHIVRREELALSNIPLAQITSQYLDYLEVLVELPLDDVADFIEVASILVEMKAKQAVPNQIESSDGDADGLPVDEISDDLVARLIEYRRVRDASSILDEQGGQWQMRYSRLATDLPPRRTELGDQPLEPIEVWDLVSAFGRILRERQPPSLASVVYDDTPIHVYMERIHSMVRDQKRIELTSLFEAGMHKSTLVALFLATLELTRHHGLSTDQQATGHPLYLVAGANFCADLDVHQIDNLSFDQVAASNLPVAPR
jgi:segregation and condensation protein A